MKIKLLIFTIVFVNLLAFSNPANSQVKRSKQQPVSLAKIYKDIVNKKLNDVPSSEGDDAIKTWQFGRNEKREIEILEENLDEDSLQVTIKIYTQDNPSAQGRLSKLKGKLQLNYSRIAGGWDLDSIDNISVTYSPYTPSENETGETNSSENSETNRQPIEPPRSYSAPRASFLVNNVFTVAPGNHQYFRFSVDNLTMVVGRFRAQGGSGNDIKVYILNEDAYENFRTGHDVPTFYNSGQVTVGTINVTLGRGTYYLVFDNGNSVVSNKAITAAVQLRPQ